MEWISLATAFTYFHDVFLPLLAAMILGGLIGWNRERVDKPAGLRTHMMVSLGAATFTLISLSLDGTGPGGQPGTDPIRAVQGVVTGIGFLGAGSIIRTKGEVHGVTTAAGIWVVGGLGAACGAAFYDVAITATVLSLVVLTLFRKLEHRMSDG